MSNVQGNEPSAASISKAATHRWFVVLVAIYISAHVQMSVLPEDINIEFIAPRNMTLPGMMMFPAIFGSLSSETALRDFRS